MHTVVFGWFGASAVWFLPLLWRVVKSVLPNGGGLRGPGTIRLWLGFFCVLLASCTLEAALFHSFAFAADYDHLGRWVLLGLSGRDGVDGSTSVLGALGVGAGAAVVFLISLPWLCDFTWRQAIAWQMVPSVSDSSRNGSPNEKKRCVRNRPVAACGDVSLGSAQAVAGPPVALEASGAWVASVAAADRVEPRSMLRRSDCPRPRNARAGAINVRQSGVRLPSGEPKPNGRHLAAKLRVPSCPRSPRRANRARERTAIRPIPPKCNRQVRATVAACRSNHSNPLHQRAG